MVADAEVVEGARAIGFTLGTPGLSMLGVVDDLLVDRAFIEQRRDSALELATVSRRPPGRTAQRRQRAGRGGAGPGVRGAGHRGPAGPARDPVGAHKIETVAERDGVRFIDDSKATNPHAADAALRAFDSVVWVAGGQAKGTEFDDLVSTIATGCAARCCSGIDRAVIAAALGRHAPDVPVIEISTDRLKPWRRPSPLPCRWPDRETRCCWPRAAPARTCTPTTPPEATPSPRRFAVWPPVARTADRDVKELTPWRP